MISISKDVLISLLIIGIILSSLYVVSGRWPPLVVIESGSMSHSTQESRLGVIDPGDIVLVQDTDEDEIKTYVEGKQTGYKKYGQYGDVIVFKPNGNGHRTPIIHRAVLYLKYNNSGNSASFDIPSFKELDGEEDWITWEGDNCYDVTGTVTIYNYGYEDVNVEIELNELLENDQSGYITMGDSTHSNAPQYDQKGSFSDDSLKPVKGEWIIGKARGELPWFGTLKLAYMGRTEDVPSNSWNNLIISIAVILLTPLMLELGSRLYYRGKRSPEEEKIEESKESEDEKKTENLGEGPSDARQVFDGEKELQEENLDDGKEDKGKSETENTEVSGDEDREIS